MTTAPPADDIPGAEVCALCLMALGAVITPAFQVWDVLQAEPAGLHVLADASWACAAWAWLWSFTRRHRLALPADAGWFVFLAWWVLLPYYAMRGAGRKAALPLLAFLGLILLGYVLGGTLYVLLRAEE